MSFQIRKTTKSPCDSQGQILVGNLINLEAFEFLLPQISFKDIANSEVTVGFAQFGVSYYFHAIKCN